MLAKNLQGAALATQPAFIEDCFSSYLYTGNGSTQTITNNIDLSGKGGLVWIKGRSGATGHRFTDTVRGATKSLASNSTAAEITEATGLTAFGSTGFTIGADADYNTSSAAYVSWTFREQPKFFDVVTYTGNGAGGGQSVAHSLSSVPGCIIIKRMDSTVSNWFVGHRVDGSYWGTGLSLNLDNPLGGSNTPPTSTAFNTNSIQEAIGLTTPNVNGATYVAYLFAHNAGGFGATGSENVISCGMYRGNGSLPGPVVTLGYEPQWVLIKSVFPSTGGFQDWYIFDTMRGWVDGGVEATLLANNSAAENGVAGAVDYASPTATGFRIDTTSTAVNRSGTDYIYIAIRRGPMKTPTSGTSVFTPTSLSGLTGADITYPNAAKSRPENVDSAWFFKRDSDTGKNFQITDRLRGWQGTEGPSVDSLTSPTLTTSSTSAESTSGNSVYQLAFNANASVSQIKFAAASSGYIFGSYVFKRAPGFFDMVCYTGTGVARTVPHNLGAVPELMIVKCRNTSSTSWNVYSSSSGNTKGLDLSGPGAAYTSSNLWNNTSPTSSVFSLGTDGGGNASGRTYVAYLFATVASVSKVGSYTGNGSNQTINCGFTGGARFILIKRTDASGDWYVWDTARGIVSGNDPRLSLNSSGAEVTTDDSVDTDSSGFIVNQLSATNINVNAATYIFLAIA